MFSLMSLCDEILCRERNDSTNAVKGLLSLATSRYCGRQEERAILIFRLLLRMRLMYVASIRLDFH